MSFNPTTVLQREFMVSLYRQENQDLEKLSSLLQATQLVSEKGELGSWVNYSICQHLSTWTPCWRQFRSMTHPKPEGTFLWAPGHTGGGGGGHSRARGGGRGWGDRSQASSSSSGSLHLIPEQGIKGVVERDLGQPAEPLAAVSLCEAWWGVLTGPQGWFQSPCIQSCPPGKGISPTPARVPSPNP